MLSRPTTTDSPRASADVAYDPRPRVALIGDARTEPDWRAIRQLTDAGLLALSTGPVNLQAGPVHTVHDPAVPAHARALRHADLAWLCQSDGTLSGRDQRALGAAGVLGVPVYSDHAPEDPGLREQVFVVDSPDRAAEQFRAGTQDAPALAWIAVQRYYARACWQRGWEGEDALEVVELLAGEVAELKDALERDEPAEARLEIADVGLFTAHLGSIMRVDVGAAITAKERINTRRFPRKPGR